MEILIKNGYVYDPLNKVNGEIMDIAIKDGKIVESSEINLGKAKIIDASQKVVMPGGIDIHSHVAGPKVNTGRIMMVSDHYRSYMRSHHLLRRSGTGKYTPSTFLTGYRYARMGWTMVVEPASPPLKTRHTHEELNDIPILDKACLILVDSNRILLNYLDRKDHDGCKMFIKWLLMATKSYGLKLVDPGTAVLWSWGKGYGLDVDDKIEPYNITPGDIIKELCKIRAELKLPHPIHLHCNRLGIPGNYETTLKTMKYAPADDKVTLHLTHLQFNAYAGDSWANIGTGSETLTKYVNANNNLSIDIGQIDFGTAVTMTADAPFEFALFHMARWKWTGIDVESEAAAGIVPYKYKKKNLVNALQWCIGLELALLVKDPWRVMITTDHPNGAPFTRYPKIIALLMSRRFREKMFAKLNRRSVKRAVLPSIEREYSLYEIAVVTRAAPARLLGLDNIKGHLGVGADADVAIYDLNPEEIDFSKDYQSVIKAFKRALYTIKSGNVVVENGKVINDSCSKTFYVDFKSPPEEQFLNELREEFKRWYTIELANYVINESELGHAKPIYVGG